MGLFNKKELARINELEQEIQTLKEQLNYLGAKDYVEIQKEIAQRKEQNQMLLKENNSLEENINELTKTIAYKEKMIAKIDDDLEMMTEWSIYTPKYDCMSSEEYADRIKAVRDQQKTFNKAEKSFKLF